MTLAWKSDLPSGEKMVLLALCDNANDQGECYPSVSMLSEKCSLSERSVFNHIAKLEKIGAIVRENRTGRSTIYHLDPCKFTQLAGESHYVYKIEDVDSGEFYLGVRTCQGNPRNDGYMGSGAWFNKRISDGKALRKTVLETFSNRPDAVAKEAELISSSKHLDGCMNKQTPANSAPCNDFTLQPLHPTPATVAPPPLQPLHPTPATVAPITINKPSIEPSINHQRKKHAPDKFVLPDWIPEETWSAFLVCRKNKKAASTDFALRLILKTLGKFKDAGHDPVAILENSIKGGWSDVYEPKNSGQGLNKQEALEARNRAVGERWASGGMMAGAI